jgi:hypothetical protein
MLVRAGMGCELPIIRPVLEGLYSGLSSGPSSGRAVVGFPGVEVAAESSAAEAGLVGGKKNDEFAWRPRV